AGRRAMPAELVMQVPVIKDVLDAMNISRLESEGFEADDIIGTLSDRAEKLGLDVVIVTGDKDVFQLVSDNVKVKMPVTRQGTTTTEDYDPETVMKRYGVTPDSMIDVKALMGDPSDNIPGIPGIGEKTALELIKKFGSLNKIYENGNLDKIARKTLREKLENNKELAYMSRRLSVIRRDIDDDCCPSDISIYKRKPVDNDRLYSLFKRLEFKSMIKKFGLSEPVEEEAESEKNEKAFKQGKKHLSEAVTAAEEIKMEGAVYFYAIKTGESMTVGFNLKTAIFHFHISDPESKQEFIKIFGKIFSDPNIKKYGHDIKDLVLELLKGGVETNGKVFDTSIAAYLINPSPGAYPIKNIAREILKYDEAAAPADLLNGPEGTYFGSNNAAEAENGAALVRALVKPMYEIIKANGQLELLDEIEFPLIRVLAHMEHSGFRVDPDKLRDFAFELDNRIAAVEIKIFILAGTKFNLNSPKQLSTVLFEKLGLPPVKKTKTGYSTDMDVLTELIGTNDIIPEIIDYRQLAKLRSTYTDALISVIDEKTGRIHTSFRQTAAVTGRISSTEPNLQNIPVKLEMGRKIRKAFVPENENYVLLDADYSQIELRILAHISDDENMKKTFADNMDIHTITASQVFSVPVEEMTPEIRNRAKAVNFGIIYGIGDFSLARDLGITRKEAREYIDGYLDRYPGVRLYMKEIVEFGRENGYVLTLMNRRRYLPELKSPAFNTRSFGERIAFNTPVQGSAADIIKKAMVDVHKRLKEGGFKSRLILQVHDELIIEALKEEKEAVRKILKECMENAVKLTVPLIAEVKEGNSWYEAKYVFCILARDISNRMKGGSA
ncbi:MAG: DNA polymerase I, partial [Eubacteriales bacterium]|nr:DNA polymerase I [Eubacteriales bacterium]